MPSCNDDIVLDEVDETAFIASGETFGYVRDATTARQEIPVTVTGSTNVHVFFGLTKATGTDVNAGIGVNTDLVQTYNEAHNTSYAAFPAAQVTIADNGNVSVAKWQMASEPVAITLTKGALEEGVYVLPVTVKNGAGVSISSTLNVLYYLVAVSDAPATPPSTDKPGGVKTLCYVEVGDASANLLNVGAYVLENSEIPFFDIAVVFAANIKYDLASGEVRLIYNESVKHILQNRDVYIKPLQDKGIKVILGVVGNWDFAGVANLSGDVLRNYAMQCKLAMDIYGLDGIDFDDEWSTYSQNTSQTAYSEFMASSWYPAWAPSAVKMSRLIIEMRRLLGPDKIITVFEYNFGRQIPADVDGVHMVDIIDYSMQAIYGSWVASSYIGMPNARYSPLATWINNMNPTASTLRTRATTIRSTYGFMFFYDLRNDDKTAYLNNASEPLYGERVKIVEPLRPHW
ncbi:MAG: DUF1735 domain-containing protein [Prevotellaceae bacterium]|nr:DUF1735 domain-containing protein [Prevotellaceae bacterium]